MTYLIYIHINRAGGIAERSQEVVERAASAIEGILARERYDPSYEGCLEVLMYVAKNHPDSAVAVFDRALASKQAAVRALAASQLVELGNQDLDGAIELAVAHCDDPDELVSSEAFLGWMSLVNLSDPVHGPETQ